MKYIKLISLIITVMILISCNKKSNIVNIDKKDTIIVVNSITDNNIPFIDFLNTQDTVIYYSVEYVKAKSKIVAIRIKEKQNSNFVFDYKRKD